MSDCEHNYQYGGLRYKDTGRRRPGSGATDVEYFHLYYCSKCLDKKLDPAHRMTNSYQEPLPGSTPL